MLATLLWVAALFFSGCLAILPSNGGGKALFHPTRQINPSDIALTPGYRIEAIATGLTFPPVSRSMTRKRRT
jgi:hypothetical protein